MFLPGIAAQHTRISLHDFCARLVVARVIPGKPLSHRKEGGVGA
jgi:hypothetical protein